MVIVDTSIWISLYRKENKPISEFLWSLVSKNEAAVCGQIWVEFLGGFKDDRKRESYQNYFENFMFLNTQYKAYVLAAQFLAHYPKLGSGDAIIAATAITEKTPLFSLDKDFKILIQHGLELFDGNF